MKRILVVLALAAAVLTVQPLALGQRDKKEDTNVRSVQGTVTDAAGNPVPGAVVHLKNTKTLQIRSFIAKEDGSYAFHGLSTNVDFELKAEHDGAVSDVRTLSVFDSRNKAVINLRLKKK
ncbi:MAG: carboxypeptidase-like regulatory domain-containing protein [Rhodospirillales bacterium]